MENAKSIFLKCDCHAETVVFTRFKWDHDNSTDYDISIEDSYCGGNYMGINGRFKRAWKAFWAKPICHAGVYIEDPERMKKFLQECLELMNTNVETIVHAKWEPADDGDGVVCTNCRTDFCTLFNCTDEFVRCPHCGAVMDGVV